MYKALGVQEYFIFDPQREYLDPPLRGYRLVNGTYELALGEVLGSEVLGLELHVKGNALHFYNPLTGSYLLTPPETQEYLEETIVRLEESEDRLYEVKVELEELKERAAYAQAENERLRAEWKDYAAHKTNKKAGRNIFRPAFFMANA